MSLGPSLRAIYDLSRGRGGIYYGWWLLGWSVFAVAIAAGISFWSFGLYVAPLEAEFGWSRAELTLGFSISLLIGGMAAFFVGRFVDLRGPRFTIVIGAVMTAVTYLLLATTSELWQWYVYQSINAIFRQMMFFIPFQALISRWFNHKRGRAVGILSTGFSIGGFAIIPLMRFVIDEVDWDGSFVFAGIMIAVVFLPIALFVVRDDPADVGQEVDGEPPSGRGEISINRIGLTVAQTLRTPLFWMIALSMTTFFYGMFGWMVHAVPYYESVGVSPSGAAALLSAGAAGGILSRLSFGFIADRIRSIELAAVVLALFLGGSLLVLLATGGSPVGIGIFLAMWIVGSGGGPMIEPLLLVRTFGLAFFASILGVLSVVETIGQIFSPVAAGAIFDATGSYDWALTMFVLALGLSAVFFWIAARMPRPLLPGAPSADAATARPEPRSLPAPGGGD